MAGFIPFGWTYEPLDQHPGDNLLLESGDNILLENGVDALLME